MCDCWPAGEEEPIDHPEHHAHARLGEMEHSPWTKAIRLPRTHQLSEIHRRELLPKRDPCWSSDLPGHDLPGSHFKPDAK